MDTTMPEFIGPPQYRINKGTCEKWISFLQTTTWLFDPSQLSFVVGKNTYGSPEGLLAAIAEPDPKFGWDGISHIYDGRQFYLSENMRKRLKIRGTIPEYFSFEQAAAGAKSMLAAYIPE